MNKCGMCIFANPVKVISSKQDNNPVFFLTCKLNGKNNSNLELLSSEEPACIDFKPKNTEA